MRTTSLRTSMFLAVFVLIGTLGLTGCRNDAQSGALLGAGLGALGGAVIGNNSKGRTAEGAAIGAGAGAIIGYVIGNESDKARASTYRTYDRCDGCGCCHDGCCDDCRGDCHYCCPPARYDHRRPSRHDW